MKNFEYTEPTPQELVDWLNNQNINKHYIGNTYSISDNSILTLKRWRSTDFVEVSETREKEFRKSRRWYFAMDWLKSVKSLPAKDCSLRGCYDGISLKYIPEKISITIKDNKDSDSPTITFNPDTLCYEW